MNSESNARVNAKGQNLLNSNEPAMRGSKR
jgi:hypothetical protein